MRFASGNRWRFKPGNRWRFQPGNPGGPGGRRRGCGRGGWLYEAHKRGLPDMLAIELAEFFAWKAARDRRRARAARHPVKARGGRTAVVQAMQY